MPEIIENCFENYWEPPEWLNQQFLTEILQKHESDSAIKITTLLMVPAVPKGEHYASCMYRIKINYSTSIYDEKSISLICKTNNLDEYTDEILKTYDVYQQEMNVYEKYLPNFEKMLKESKCGNITLGPKAYFIHFEKNSIIFEDLMQLGYEMAIRTNGLNLQHAELSLEKLAQFHAASVVYNAENNNELAKYFQKGMFNRKAGGINPFFQANINSLANEVAQWPNWEKIAKKLFKLKDRLVENARYVFDAKEGDFHVLVHGDLWVNNVMFKYDDDKSSPVDVVMVDFQMCTWGSPAIDLLYFMATSLTDDLRENYQDDLIQFYYNHLVKFLTNLNCPTDKIPTLHRLQIEILKNYFYSFTSTVLVLPVQMSEHSDGADFQTLMGLDDYSDSFRKNIYSSEKLHKILKRVLPMFDRKGILDL